MLRSSPDRYGIYEAKARLSELIERVAAGEEIVITRHGTPVARLVAPDADALDGQKALDALARLREIGREVGFDLTAEEIRAFIDEGRR